MKRSLTLRVGLWIGWCLTMLVATLAFAQAPANDSDELAEEVGKLLSAAKRQIGVTLSYDPAYRKLDYPNGDVPRSTGVCTDVVIRAYRDGLGIDLQRLVHEDMRNHFGKYPNHWGLRRPDRHIDHRRVPNLMRYFERQGATLPISDRAADYQAGDIVTWDLGRGITHIGLVSEQFAANGHPLIIHNIGAGTRAEDILFKFTVTGHYRWFAPAEASRDARPR